MEKTAKIKFSKEHVGKSSKELETDTLRTITGTGRAPRKEKIGHNPAEERKVPIRKVKDS